MTERSTEPSDPARDPLAAALDETESAMPRMSDQIQTWNLLVTDAAARKDWPMADRYRYLASGAGTVLNEWRAAIRDTPPTTPGDWTALANDIRLVDGNHDLGAGELAARLIERGWQRSAE